MTPFHSKITTSDMALKQRHKTGERVTNEMKMGETATVTRKIANTALQAAAILHAIASKTIYVLAT